MAARLDGRQVGSEAGCREEHRAEDKRQKQYRAGSHDGVSFPAAPRAGFYRAPAAGPTHTLSSGGATFNRVAALADA
jgi:hypothetical protein